MITDTEQITVKAKLRQWRNVRSGWMVIKPGHLLIFRSKFIGGPEEVANFDTSRITEIEQDPANYDLQLTFSGSQGEMTIESFALVREKNSESVDAVLDILLRDLQERRKQQEEEAARAEKEQQERQRKIRESFACEIWETSEILWLITRAAYSMVQAVILADWDETRQQYSIIWQQADKLKNVQGLDLMTALTELDETVNSRNGPEVIRKASNLLMQLAEHVLQTEVFWSKWQESKEMLSAMSPNCNHLPYFLLFSTGHFEALLSARVEDWAGMNNALPRLQLSGIILQSCFAVELNGLIGAASFAVGERNMELFINTARRVEDTVFASIRSKFFKFDPSIPSLVRSPIVNEREGNSELKDNDEEDQALEVENYGSVPEQS